MRALLLSVVLISCARLPPQPWTHVGPSRVLEIVTRRQCSLCHSVESVFGSTSSDEVESTTPTCQREGHCAVPTLASMGRFRAKWLRSFLEKPIDVRPGLAEQMIPHALSPQEIDALITGWGAVDEPASEVRGEVASGALLFEQKQCGSCHRFGSRSVGGVGALERVGGNGEETVHPERSRGTGPADSVSSQGPLDSARGERAPSPSEPPFSPGMSTELHPLSPSEVERLRALAPDLQHTRHRLTLATLERFIFSPASVKPTSAMPRPAVTLDEAQALARYVYFSELP